MIKKPINNFEWSESFDFPASWAEEDEDQLTRQFKPEFQGCPQRETQKGLWSDLHARSSVSVDTFRPRSFARGVCIFFSLAFFRLSIYSQLRSLGLPHKILLRADLTFALIVKVRCVGRRKRADEGTGKGTWKWKATFQASRCGEGSPATKDDRTLRTNAPAHRDKHVLFKVTGPPTSHSRAVPSPSEDLVPFIEIRRIDCRDCARNALDNPPSRRSREHI